jgi:TonB family protein
MRNYIMGLMASMLACAAVAQTPSDPAFQQPNEGPDAGLHWAHKPSGRELLDRYPAAALKKGVQGQALLHCRSNAAGRMEDCTVDREQPKDLGFGAAALQLSTSFMMKSTGAGSSVDGVDVYVPVTFSLYRFNQDHPLWASVPTKKDVIEAYPIGENADALVSVRCLALLSGVLTNCLTSSRSALFEEAALRLVEKFKAKPFAFQNGDSFVPVAFKILMASATSKVWQVREIKTVMWSETPTVKMFDAAYPDEAKTARLASGRAVLNCTVKDSGQLAACVTESEEPVQMGFGAGAKAVAEQFVMNPWTEEGLPVGGAYIRLPVKLEQPAKH